jgi:predicted phage terminase large subunit-like protein
MTEGNFEAFLDGLLADPVHAAHALDCADARESLLDYCGLIEIPGAPLEDEEDEAPDALFRAIETPVAAHHRLLIDKLQALAEGRIVHEGKTVRRMMVFMPPGSAKSTYASVVFPSWCMGKWPRYNIGLATHTTDLARKMGRRIRSIVKQRVYRDIFGTGLAPDQAAANEWALESGNEFMGAGILAGWTGNRMDGIVVDDPVKSREEADSATIQQKTRAEFDESLMTRLKPNGWALIIQTRWNESDLSGGLLPSGWSGESGVFKCSDGRFWYVLCIPAEAERGDVLGRQPGEMLWPEWFGLDPDFWTAARANPRTWSALYQQRPAPDEGTFFQRAWLKCWEAQPEDLRIYGTSDYAVTEGGGDYTVHRVWGVSPSGGIYRLDGWRGQTAADKWIERKLDLIEKWKPMGWFGEAGVIQKAVEPMLLRRMKERGVRCRLEWLPSIADKPTRARGFQARAAMGEVWFEPGADVGEFLSFPAGKHDDDVDAASLLGRALDMAHPALVPPPKDDKPAELKGINEMTFNEAVATYLQPKQERV